MISSSITFEVLRLELLDYFNNDTYYLKCYLHSNDEKIEKVNFDNNLFFQNSEFCESIIIKDFYLNTSNISIYNKIPLCYFSDNLSTIFDRLNYSDSFRIQGRYPELDTEVIVEGELFNILKLVYNISLEEISPIPLNFTFFQDNKYINLPLNLSIVGFYSINDPTALSIFVNFENFNPYYSFQKYIFGKFALGQEIFDNMTLLKNEFEYFEPSVLVSHNIEIVFDQSQGLFSTKTNFLQKLDMFLDNLNMEFEESAWLYDQSSNVLLFYENKEKVTTYLLLLQSLSLIFFAIILILIDNYFLKLNNKQTTSTIEELYKLGITFKEIKKSYLFLQLRDSCFQILLVTLLTSFSLIVINFINSYNILYDLLVKNIIFHLICIIIYSFILFMNKIMYFNKLIEYKKQESNPIELIKDLGDPISSRKKKSKKATKFIKIMLYLVILYLFFIPESILLKNDYIFPGIFGEIFSLNYTHILPMLPVILYILLPFIPFIIIRLIKKSIDFFKKKTILKKGFFNHYMNKITSTEIQIRKSFLYLLFIVGCISTSLLNNSILTKSYLQESNQDVFGADLILYERSYLFDWRNYNSEEFSYPMSNLLLENIESIASVSQTKECRIDMYSLKFSGLVIDKTFFSCIDFNKTEWNKDRNSIKNDLNESFEINRRFIIISQRIFNEYGGKIEQNDNFWVYYNKTSYFKDYYVIGYTKFIPGIDLNIYDYILFDDSLNCTYTYFDDYEDEYIAKYYIKLENSGNPINIKKEIQDKYASRIFKIDINDFKFYKTSESSFFWNVNTADINLLGYDIYMNFLPYLLFNQLLLIMYGIFLVFIIVFYINDIQNHKNSILSFLNIGLSKKESIRKISKSILKEYFYLTLLVVPVAIFISFLAYRVQYYIFFSGNIFLFNPFEIHTSRFNAVYSDEGSIIIIRICLNPIYTFSFGLNISSFTFLLLGVVYFVIFILSKSTWFSKKVIK